MGGVISVMIALAATFCFAFQGRLLPAIGAGIVAVACVASWLQMWYFARMLARNRIFFAALQRGEFEEGSEAANHYWKNTPLVIEQQDVLDVPDWISWINLIATVCAALLLIWAVIVSFV